MNLRATLAEAMTLLRETHAAVKTLASRRGAQGPRRMHAEAMTVDGAKPCVTCAMATKCQRACMSFDQWVAATGLDRARPGVRDAKAVSQ